MPFSRGSSWPRDWTRVSCTAGGFFTVWVTREAHGTVTKTEQISLQMRPISLIGLSSGKKIAKQITNQEITNIKDTVVIKIIIKEHIVQLHISKFEKSIKWFIFLGKYNLSKLTPKEMGKLNKQVRKIRKSDTRVPHTHKAPGLESFTDHSQMCKYRKNQY